MSFLQCLIWKKIWKKNVVTDFLDCTQGTQRTPQIVQWPCEPIIFPIGHFEGPSKFRLNS